MDNFTSYFYLLLSTATRGTFHIHEILLTGSNRSLYGQFCYYILYWWRRLSSNPGHSECNAITQTISKKEWATFSIIFPVGIFLFITVSRTALDPTQPPIQWIPGSLSLGAKRAECEADHSLPSCAEIKECVELYLYSPNTSWSGA